MVVTAVRCATEQLDVSTEAIVVVDGPEAERWEEIPQLRAPDVRVLASPGKSGVADARNRGIAAASAAHVAFLDDDDLWAPDKLARQLAATRAHDAVFGYASAAILSAERAVRWIDLAPPADELKRHALANNPIPACSSNLVVRTDVARAVGFDPDLMHFADWDFALRLLDAGTGAACPEVLVGYVWHAENMHFVRLNGIEREFRRFRGKQRAGGRRVGSPSQSRWLAGNYRENGRRLRASGTYLRGAIRYRSFPDLVRAGGVLLGDRAMGLAGGRRHKPDAEPPDVGWLGAHR